MVRSRPHAPSLIVAAYVALALLVIAGCSTIKGVADTSTALQREGYSKVKLNAHDDNGVTTVDVRADSSSGDAAKAAGIVWRELPFRVDAIDSQVNGQGRTYDRASLEQTFGPRPAGKDDKSLAKSVGVPALIGLGVGGLVCLGLVGLVIYLIVRRSRRRRPPGPAGPAAGPTYPQTA